MRQIAWTVSNGLIDYPVSLKKMKARVDLIQSGDALEQIDRVLGDQERGVGSIFGGHPIANLRITGTVRRCGP